MTSDPGASVPRTLALRLRSAMHVAIAVLLTVGAGRAILVDGVAPVLAAGAAAVIAALYLAGIAVLPPGEDVGRPIGPHAVLPGRLWTLALVVAWAGATLVSGAFVWLAFPLFFLALFTLPRRAALPVLAIVAGWAILVPARAGDGPQLAEVLGPLIGLMFALIADAVFRQLVHEADRNRRLVADLRAAQSDLAVSERRQGVLAERERIARDLHDTLAQGLNSIVLRARAAAAQHPEAALELEALEVIARTNLAEARRLVRDLSEHSGDSPLEEQLRGLAGETERLAAPLTVVVRVDGSPRPVPTPVGEALLRATQGLLANVQRHAHASRCVLTLGFWEDRIALDVADDGRGFDPDRPRAQRHDGGDGLRLLRERVAALGGTIAVESAPGDGTTVALTVPLAASAAGAVAAAGAVLDPARDPAIGAAVEPAAVEPAVDPAVGP